MVEMLHVTVYVGSVGWLILNTLYYTRVLLNPQTRHHFCVPTVAYEANIVKKTVTYKEHSPSIEKWAKEESTAISRDKNVLQRKQRGR